MGFAIYYRSTRPVDAARAEVICQAADVLNAGRTWLSCEPVGLRADDADGHLVGRSKPNFHPDPDDIKSARRQALPDGTVRILIDILRRISCEHGVDWEISHDYDPGPLGFIRNGQCDPQVLNLAEGFNELGDILASELSLADLSSDDDEEDDEEPRILKFPGR